VFLRLNKFFLDRFSLIEILDAKNNIAALMLQISPAVRFIEVYNY